MSGRGTKQRLPRRKETSSHITYTGKIKRQDSKTLEDSPRARLLFMAGIYSVGEGAGGKQIYSYSVLTREADSCLSWLHHRYKLISMLNLTTNDTTEMMMTKNIFDMLYILSR